MDLSKITKRCYNNFRKIELYRLKMRIFGIVLLLSALCSCNFYYYDCDKEKKERNICALANIQACKTLQLSDPSATCDVYLLGIYTCDAKVPKVCGGKN